MSKPNHVCKMCNTEYYACVSCLKAEEFYKNAFCSKKCYEKFVEYMQITIDKED